MALDLSILYRGPLSSCNYDCSYCPFAKHHETAAELAVDRRALQRFVEWIAEREGDRLSVFFTPWGEALIRRWYREALVRLTSLPQIAKAAIQTNLSCPLDWVQDCDRRKLALWATFHPSQTTVSQFLMQCRELDRANVRYSVGAVGLKDDFETISQLRRELSPSVYLWINAYKRTPDYYTQEDLTRWESIDPLFRINTVRHASWGRSCRCGTSVVSVDGDGAIRRCHFIEQPIGNIYETGFERNLFDRPCTNQTCGCHIGYVHLDELNLYSTFENGILERIPRQFSRR
jgi:MoaA/NifB/PqqE/SkfB family radical SAM enzyme